MVKYYKCQKRYINMTSDQQVVPQKVLKLLPNQHAISQHKRLTAF